MTMMMMMMIRNESTSDGRCRPMPPDVPKKHKKGKNTFYFCKSPRMAFLCTAARIISYAIFFFVRLPRRWLLIFMFTSACFVSHALDPMPLTTSSQVDLAVDFLFFYAGEQSQFDHISKQKGTRKV
jgi:hypothetical protein